MASISDIEFEINVVGEVSKERFFGKFKCTPRLSFRQQMTKDKIRRELLGDLAQYASPRILEQATIFADMAVSITDSPDWFKAASLGQDLVDDQTIEAIWLGIQKAQGNLKEDEAKKTKSDTEALKKAVETKEAEKAEPEEA